jgi:hypothetical protein
MSCDPFHCAVCGTGLDEAELLRGSDVCETCAAAESDQSWEADDEYPDEH